MAERPKILLITAGKLALGGVENHLLTLVNGLKDRFIFVLVGDLGEPFHSHWEQLGQQTLLYSPSGTFDRAAWRKLRQVIRQEKPDVIHIHDSRAGFLARLANIGCGVPVIYSMHYPSYEYVDAPAIKRFFYREVERIFNWLLTDRIIFLFQNIYQDTVRKLIAPPARSKVIRTGLEVERFSGSAGDAVETTQLIVIARLAYEKRVELALQTTALLAVQGFPVFLTIVGDGPEWEKQHAEAERLGITEKVAFLGIRDDVPELLAQADLFLLTSRYEGGPYSVMEAMAAGKPCISTLVGDAPWLLGDGAGVLVEDPTPDNFAAAAAGLIENEEARSEISKRARQKAIAEFSLERMIEEYDRLYRELVRSKQ